MANDRTDILFPEGRLIMGSLYKGSDKDDKGNPRVIKNGPNKGNPITQFFMGVAIPKRGEQHWSQTEWGQKILAVGAAAFPNVYQGRTFAWKIDDGDSTEPNKKGRKPCDNEGAKGHWIVKLSSGYAPKVYQQPSPGTFVEMAQPEAVKVGYWIQVSGNAAGNGSTESPGVYLNHNMVLFVRADAEITTGPDAASVFGGAAVSQALPGAAAMPFGAAVPPALSLPSAAAMPFGAVVPPSAAAIPSPVLVQPNHQFLGMPAIPSAPAVPAEPTLTAKGVASGFTYAQYRTGGWTDEVMRANGIIN